jgi:hypothetical protein
MYEPYNRIDVVTPKGDGTIWLVTEYGHETDTIYTVIINATGELWQFVHKDIRVKSNTTFSRYGKGQELDSESSKPQT